MYVPKVPIQCSKISLLKEVVNLKSYRTNSSCKIMSILLTVDFTLIISLVVNKYTEALIVLPHNAEIIQVTHYVD
jgi:hypothetical protein